MPDNTPQAKRAAVVRYGGEVTWCEPTLAARERAARALIAATGAVLVHPYDDLAVMAGQATAGVELLEAVPDLDVILCPVGGGGLLGGTAVAARTLKPTIRVIGVEPAGADDAARSFRSGQILPSVNPNTIADGLRASLSARTFAILREHVAGILRVTEAEIISTMRLVWERMKIIIEPSSAVAIAPLLKPDVLANLGLPARADGGKLKLGVIFSGGNVDLSALPF